MGGRSVHFSCTFGAQQGSFRAPFVQPSTPPHLSPPHCATPNVRYQGRFRAPSWDPRRPPGLRGGASARGASSSLPPRPVDVSSTPPRSSTNRVFFPNHPVAWGPRFEGTAPRVSFLPLPSSSSAPPPSSSPLPLLILPPLPPCLCPPHANSAHCLRMSTISAHPSHGSWPHRELHRRPKWACSHASAPLISARPSRVSLSRRELHRTPKWR